MDVRSKLQIYIEENLEPVLYETARVSMPVKTCEFYAEPKFMKKSSSIDDFIKKEKDDPFSTFLFFLIDRNNLKDSDVYHKANIDRRLFSKIRSNEEYHPSKETVIALGLALELNIEELEQLLKKASYSLPKNNVFDLIIRFCVQEKIYDIWEVNRLLSEYSCTLLGNIEKDA